MTALTALRRQTYQTRTGSNGVFVYRALGLVAAAMVTGLVFAAWQSNGPALLEAFAANGLAWCL
jgi:hypothetical protein